MLNYYCDFCKKLWTIIAYAKGFECCPDCLGELQTVNPGYTPEQGSKSELKDKFAMKFTEAEKKAIYREWRKHIEQIPVSELVFSKKEYMKNYMRNKRSKVTSEIC